MSARDLTNAETIKEEIRCHIGMIGSWKRRREETPQHLDEQRAIIAAAQARIIELEEQDREAPARIVEYTKRLADARRKLALWNNRHGVEKLQRLAKQVREMQAQIDAIVDPEERAAAQAVLGNMRI